MGQGLTLLGASLAFLRANPHTTQIGCAPYYSVKAFLECSFIVVKEVVWLSH